LWLFVCGLLFLSCWCVCDLFLLLQAVVNILSVDQKISKATLEKAVALPDVSEAHCLHLG